METFKRLLVVDRSRCPGVVAGAVYLCEWRIAGRGEAWVTSEDGGANTIAWPCSGHLRVPSWVINDPTVFLTDIGLSTRDLSEPVTEVVAETKPKLRLRYNWNEEAQ